MLIPKKKIDPKVLIAIPACRTLNYSKWESVESPHYNPHKDNVHYDKGVHLSGPNTRLATIRETWAQDIINQKNLDLKFFHGLPQEQPPQADEVYLECSDAYEFLPVKVVALCRWAVENDYDWIFKADDDTYIWIDRLIAEIQCVTFDYAGFNNHGRASGGPGYWLSRKAFTIIANSPPPSHWSEDVVVGRLLTEAGIPFTPLGTHLPGQTEHWFNLNHLPKYAISIHAVRPADMYKLYNRL